MPEAKEIREQHVESMGAELGTVFHELWNECVLLHWKWEEFVTLFGSTPERVELLNRAAGAFFRIVQDTLWEDVLLHISRLTDPPSTFGKENLTLLRLPSIVDVKVRASVEALIQECLAKCEFARDWRRRRIAHRDLLLALEDSKAVPLAIATRKAAKDAIESVAKVLTAVEVHYEQSNTHYELRPLGNAETLLYVIREGIQAETKRRERIESGTYTAEDLERLPPI
jgi:hypothetical protein